MSLLVISSWWDLSEGDGTSTNMTNLFSLILKKFKETYFLTPNRKFFVWKNKKLSFSKTYRYINWIGPIHPWIFLDFNPFYQKAVDDLIKMHNIKVVALSFPWGINYIRLKHPEIKIIYIANGYERAFIFETFKWAPLFVQKIISTIVGEIEKRSVKNSDLIISVGDILTQELKMNLKVPPEKIETIKMGFNFNSIDSNKYNRDEVLKKYQLDPDKKYFVFHGGRLHPPNREAHDLITNKIAPEVWKIDKSIGFVSIGKGNRVYQKDNVVSLSFIDDLNEIFSVMYGAIMPIISGSGIRIKAMDYIINSLPMISTKKGIEGYGFTDNELVFTENKIDKDFIDKVVWLANNEEKAKELARNCLEKSKRELDNQNLDALLDKAFSRRNII